MNPFLEPHGDDLIAQLDATIERVTKFMDAANAETWANARRDQEPVERPTARIAALHRSVA